MSWSNRFCDRGDQPAILTGGSDIAITYVQLADEIDLCRSQFKDWSIGRGGVVSFTARYDVRAIALFFACMEGGTVAVPLPPDSPKTHQNLLALGQATHVAKDDQSFVELNATGEHQLPPLYQQLIDAERPGLVLFTSGTTGQPKAAVHDLVQLCTRHSSPRPPARVLAFMHIDHIGGVNTLLHVLSHGGTLVVPASRTPQDVCETIAQHKAEVLPVSPTFLNLMLISGAIDQYDLSSLKRVTYGSEPMPEIVLKRIGAVLPDVDLLQTYGLTEVGILKSKSRDNSTLWMKVGGEGFDTKIVDGRLWIRAATAMLGYLNASSPFDEQGYMDTGDLVEVQGEWLRILGRKSEVINVGGQKISPVEVESVLLEMPSVEEVSVWARPHPLTGQVVAASVHLADEEPLPDFKIRMRRHCRERLPAHAIPVKLELADGPLVTDRFKRQR